MATTFVAIKSIFVKHFLLVTLLPAITMCATAQGIENPANKKTAFVTGTLTDDVQKRPVAEARVSLVNVKDSSLVAFTGTDSSGKFSFINYSHAATGYPCRTKNFILFGNVLI